MAHDALGAHAQDELGISVKLKPRPIQAALASAASFAVGAALPLVVTGVVPQATLIPLSPEHHCCSWLFWADWLRALEVQA